MRRSLKELQGLIIDINDGVAGKQRLATKKFMECKKSDETYRLRRMGYLEGQEMALKVILGYIQGEEDNLNLLK